MADTRDGYWRRQLTRRRWLGAAAGTVGGAAALASVGCGDDDDSTPSATSTKSADGSPSAGASASASATAQPKRGGTTRRTVSNFPVLDVHMTQDATARGLANQVYGLLWQLKGVPLGPQYPSQDLLPDLAMSWEQVDPTTITAKLNPKAKWQAPLSRPFTSDDVIFTFDRFLGKVPGVNISAVANQMSMLDSYSAPDKQTVTFKLKAPNALFMLRTADSYTMPILPTEYGSGFDPTKTMVGTGPFILDSVEPPRGWKLKRNPDWHLGPDRPYLDSIEVNVVADPATLQSQFKGGNIDGVAASPDDLAPIKAAVKDVRFVAQLQTFYEYISFSGKDPNSPWNKDIRVRQALSMCIDRNAIFEALYSPDTVQKAGLPRPDILWHGAVGAGLGKYWLDPKGDKIKPELKQYFVYNPEKAKALLAEAGYPDGLTIDYHYTAQYGAQHTLQAELIPQMASKGGFKLVTKIDDFTSVYNPKTFLGDYDGVHSGLQGFGTDLEYYLAMYDPTSRRNQTRVDDKKINDDVAKLLADTNTESRLKGSLDLQQYMLEKLYYVPTIMFAGPAYNAVPPYLHLADRYTSRTGAGFNSDPYIWTDKA